MDNPALILHICGRHEWENAIFEGVYTPDSVKTEGFIHCSRPDQVLEAANLFFRDMPDLVLLCIDPGLLDSELRWDPVGNDSFPHIYGPLNPDAVLGVEVLTPDQDGVYRRCSLC
jgi:uncharacterized protein (DUF952 family)